MFSDVCNSFPFCHGCYLMRTDGMGPLLWSPMSEIPIFGRNVPYISTFAIYVILCVPTALVNNLGGFLFLRFLTGFFGSPCLANGGATMQDLVSQSPSFPPQFVLRRGHSFIHSISHMRLQSGPLVCWPRYFPYTLSVQLTTPAAFCGPALGPLLSGFSVPAEGHVLPHFFPSPRC
jgi:DHA1 family multidrug resistance protein-like MFS transporter